MLSLGDLLPTIPQSQPIKIYTYNKKRTLSGKETIFSGIRAQYDDRKLGIPVCTLTSVSGVVWIEIV